MVSFNRVFLVDEAESVLVGFSPDAEWMDIFDGRIRSASGAFERAMLRMDPVARIDGATGTPQFRFGASRRSEICKRLRAIDRRVSALLEAPLTPRLVNTLLGISSQERIRWTKDGRLPTHGGILSQRGSQSFTVQLFQFHEIVRLARTPDTVREWRLQNNRDDADIGLKAG